MSRVRVPMTAHPDLRALVEMLDAVPCVEYCECGRAYYEHEYWEDKIHDVNGRKCPHAHWRGDYRFSPALTAARHKDARVEALTAALDAEATRSEDEQPTHGNGRCTCGHLSNDHACDHEAVHYGCAKCNCVYFSWDKTPISAEAPRPDTRELVTPQAERPICAKHNTPKRAHYYCLECRDAGELTVQALTTRPDTREILCACCQKKPATCFGVYEDVEQPITVACDDCCGHGNEDGWCRPIAEITRFLPTARPDELLLAWAAQIEAALTQQAQEGHTTHVGVRLYHCDFCGRGWEKKADAEACHTVCQGR